MVQDHLGIYDTPPDRREVQLALALVVSMFVSLPIILTAPNIRLAEVDAVVPMVDAIMILGDLITATLLYVQAAVFRSRALTVLATGFVFSALMLAAHLLTFPGAFAPDGLLGAGINTTGWIANFWRAALPIAVILYLMLKRADSAQPPGERPAARIILGLSAAIALAAAATLLATIGHDLLPSLFVDRYDVETSNLTKLNYAFVALLIITITILFRQRKSVLDMWLLVALSAALSHTLLNLQASGRFTVYFYCQFGLVVFSHLVVMLALIAESSRLYARLALSVMAQKRERDARLMSMDAVAAAISHEVGQPLSAVNTNALAGLNWLTRPRPDLERAVTALHAALDAGHRAFDIIKGIQAMFANETLKVSQFSLNDLVRETVSLLARELTGITVSLHLARDEALPRILGDRVQLQQVLVNLITNAIESVGVTRGRPRRIAIRTVPLDGEELLLEVHDSGLGIDSDEMERIFETFYTTKATGTGLGLALCRTIVEEHGGRLWASQGKQHGAIFHIQLPRRRSLEAVA